MSSTRRIRTTGGGSGGGGGTDIVEAGDTDAKWNDFIDLLDAIALTTVLQDEVEATDAFQAITATLFDTVQTEDQLQDATIQATYDEQVQLTETSLDPSVTLQDSLSTTAALQAITTTLQDTTSLTDALTAADVTLSDSIGLLESTLHASIDLFDAIGLQDSIGNISPTLQDEVSITDDIPTAAITLDETMGESDAFFLTVNHFIPTDDAWIDESNADTNHGYEDDLLFQAPDAFGNNEKRALLLFDLTGLDDLDFQMQAGTTMTFRFVARKEGILGDADANIDFITFNDKPFDESTVTWNNRPTGGSIEHSETVTISNDTNTEETFTMDEFDFEPLLGHWVIVEFSNGNTVDRPDMFVQSKDDGNILTDDSGNGHTLTKNGLPTLRESPSSKFAEGFDLDGVDDFLQQPDAALDITGDLSGFFDFELDTLPSTEGNGMLLFCQNEGGEDSPYFVQLNANDTIRYMHNDTSGGTVDVDSSSTVSTGELRLTIQRQVNADGTGRVVIKINGTTFIDHSWSTDQTPSSGATELFIGSLNGGARFLDGGFYEGRIWTNIKGTLDPSDDDVLDDIADPNDATHEQTAEGTEEALWFVESGTNSQEPAMSSVELELV